MVKTSGLLAPAVLALAISVWLASSAEARHRKYKLDYDFRYSRQYQDARQFQRVPQFRDIRESQDDDFLRSRDDEVAGRGAFAGVVVALVHTCNRQAAELDRLPFDAIAQIVQPNDTQRGALDDLRSIVAATVDKLTSECPREFLYPSPPGSTAWSKASTPRSPRSTRCSRPCKTSTARLTTSKRHGSLCLAGLRLRQRRRCGSARRGASAGA